MYDAKANRAFRNDHDARINVGKHMPKINRIPGGDFSYGRANRPQTPVDGIIRNEFGEESVSHLQQKYVVWKQMQNSTKGLTGIRMTNAQIAADNAIKSKLATSNPEAAAGTKKEFKLKRFQNVDARTSTKRTGNGYASKNIVPVQASYEATQE